MGGIGEAPTRAEAARWVAAQASRLGYIDDLITSSIPSPVSEGELAEFTRFIRQVGVSRADACARELPELTAIPSAADLADRFTKLAQLQASVRSLTDAVHDWGLAVACGRERLQNSPPGAKPKRNGWPNRGHVAWPRT